MMDMIWIIAYVGAQYMSAQQHFSDKYIPIKQFYLEPKLYMDLVNVRSIYLN